jgi:hypothetical protein
LIKSAANKIIYIHFGGGILGIGGIGEVGQSLRVAIKSGSGDGDEVESSGLKVVSRIRGVSVQGIGSDSGIRQISYLEAIKGNIRSWLFDGIERGRVKVEIRV